LIWLSCGAALARASKNSQADTCIRIDRGRRRATIANVSAGIATGKRLLSEL